MFTIRTKRVVLASRLLFTALLALVVYWTVVAPFRTPRALPKLSPTFDREPVSQQELDDNRAKIATLTPQTTCNNPAIADEVVVVVKTGATEAYTKLPTQLLTSLRCVPNLLLVSDLEQDISGYHLHDVLVLSLIHI